MSRAIKMATSEKVCKISPKQFDVTKLMIQPPTRGKNGCFINVLYKYSDGVHQPLRMKTPTLFSFGVSDMYKPRYSISLKLDDDEHQEFRDVITEIEGFIRKDIVKHRAAIKQLGIKKPLQVGELHILKGEERDLMYSKLIMDGKKIGTKFRFDGEMVDPLEYVGQCCKVVAVLTVDRVFIGSQNQAITTFVGPVIIKEKVERKPVDQDSDVSEDEDDE